MEVLISYSSLAPWDYSQEPTQCNVRQWLDHMYSKYQPVENARWQQAHTDSMFYAGNQNFINGYFNFSPNNSAQQFHFNLIQQPINLITGFQRQHRKSFNYIPSEGADPNTTDQYTRIITHISNVEGIHEAFSKACELAAISGMVLMQPYLDFTSDDQAQGSLKIKIWEYNSFLVDPYYRSPDMSDAQFLWCQEYISKNEALLRFSDKQEQISSMTGTMKRAGNFYFLPENQAGTRNDLLVLSYVWYKWSRKKKRLYSKKKNQFFDFTGGEENLEQILYGIPDLQTVTVDAPIWKCAVVLNDQLISVTENPLGYDAAPMIPVFWNYDPHISEPNLRVRSLVRPLRDPQFLFNRKVITNNDITEATINAGWIRKSGAVANEENLKRTGQGLDIIINDGYETTDIQKIVPSGVPQSDLALAQQMADLVYSTSGIQMENWSGQEDKQVSSLTVLLKQAANLMVFQKYFDQWDYSLKLLGERMIQIVLNNWNAEKVALLLGEEPSPHFYSKVFAKYQTIVEEGLLTATQKSFQAQQMLDLNQAFGREVIPASMIIKNMNIQGKVEIMQYLEQQEKQSAAAQSELQNIQHTLEEAKLKELYSKAVANLALARERHGRSESNIGLFEERLSQVSKNHSMAAKEKMAALAQLVETIDKFGEIETKMKANELSNFDFLQEAEETRAKTDAKRTSLSNDFVTQIMSGQPLPGQQQMQGGQQQGQQGQEQQGQENPQEEMSEMQQ